MKPAFLYSLLAVAGLALTACNSQSNQCSRAPRTQQQLIEDAESFGIDTVVTAPTDTLVSTSVDNILRRYPELYHAVKKSKKAFAAWADQQQMAGLDTGIHLLAVDDLLGYALLNTADEAIATTGQPASIENRVDTISNLYLKLIDAAPDNRKTSIGRSRKAWKDYADLLLLTAAALPEDCRSRFCDIMASRLQTFQSSLSSLTS